MALSVTQAEEAAPTQQSLAEWMADVMTKAHQRTVRATTAEMAAYLQDVFGQKLTAVMTGVDHPKTVGKWIQGQTPHGPSLARLRDAFHVAVLLELADSRHTARAWFMGMNPDLSDRAPALVLADEPDGGALVMGATRTFLAHG